MAFTFKSSLIFGLFIGTIGIAMIQGDGKSIQCKCISDIEFLKWCLRACHLLRVHARGSSRNLRAARILENSIF